MSYDVSVRDHILQLSSVGGLKIVSFVYFRLRSLIYQKTTSDFTTNTDEGNNTAKAIIIISTSFINARITINGIWCTQTKC